MMPCCHRILLIAGCSILFASNLLKAQSNEEAAAPPPAMVDFEPPTDIEDALDKALVDIRSAEGRGPNSQEAFQRSGKYLDYAYQQDRNNLRLKYYIARRMILADQAAQALSTLKDWTNSREGASDWEAFLILGKLYGAGEYHKLAKPMLDTALALNPQEPSILLALSKCEAKLLHPAEAARRAKEAIQLLGEDKAGPAAYLLFANALMLNKQLDDADRAAQLAVDIAAAAVRNTIGSVPSLKTFDQCLLLSRQIKLALLKERQTDWNIWLQISAVTQQRATVAMHLATHEAFAISWEGLQAAGDNAPEPLILDVVRLLLRLGRQDQAISVADQMLKLHPDNAEIRQLLDLLDQQADGGAAPTPPAQAP